MWDPESVSEQMRSCGKGFKVQGLVHPRRSPKSVRGKSGIMAAPFLDGIWGNSHETKFDIGTGLGEGSDSLLRVKGSKFRLRVKGSKLWRLATKFKGARCCSPAGFESVA